MNTILAIFGWIMCIVFLGYISMIAWVCAFTTLGTYNIGGKLNTWGEKIGTLIFIGIVAAGWYHIFFTLSPFTIGVVK